MKLLGKSWKYINEGNAHIVVQLLDTEYVLRLIKEDEKTAHQSDVYDSVNFVNLIMVPLLENKFYGCEEAIEIPQHDLEQLSKILQPLRPANRIFKSILSHVVIKATNLSIVSPKCETNYCIEIKPKEGFISSSLRKYSKCYYCLKQHLKLQTGAIPETSRYCPLDLFSGEKQRMKHSLMNMIHNPQNNFKLFKDGRLIFHERSSQNDFENIVRNMNYFSELDLFLDFIVDILLSDKNVSHINLRKSKHMIVKNPSNQCFETRNLKCNTILYNLLQLQKLSEINTFDLIDIKNKYTGYVPKMIEELKLKNLDLNIPNDREKFLNTDTDGVHLALISAVAKDCSIMISFSTDYVKNFPYVELEESKIFYKLALTDLEPKSPATLSKRRDTERKLIEIYEKFIEPSINKKQECEYFKHCRRYLFIWVPQDVLLHLRINH